MGFYLHANESVEVKPHIDKRKKNILALFISISANKKVAIVDRGKNNEMENSRNSHYTSQIEFQYSIKSQQETTVSSKAYEQSSHGVVGVISALLNTGDIGHC